MKFGKIRIEDGYLVFTRHMRMNSLPCKDILWAYMRREGMEGGVQKQLIANYLVIVTRRRKRYKFDMTEREVQDCLKLLKALNPEMTVGFPRNGRLSLQSLPNTRDLGALLAEDGRHILPRKLLRSGAMYHISMADQTALLQEYRLRTVIDLRSSAERKLKPDTVLPGVEYYHIPILDEGASWIPYEQTLEGILDNLDGSRDEYMIHKYANLLKDQYSVKQFARFLDVILRQEEGSVLWHCGMGKDLTGVGTALLLCALGVSREVIREDFLRTNAYLNEEMEYMIRFLENRTIVDAHRMDNIRVLFKVKAEYLDAVFETIENCYGSIERFLRRELYLTPKTLEDLQDKYLI
ncbi:MAG: tyrosine-protein phosphatase [Eubacteriales bacterium]|nr:tyrosine-protein phosphatase [Eubacteriales bacterium]